MPMVEIIRLRSVGAGQSDVLILLESHLEQCSLPEHLSSMEIYGHANLEGDISIHLIWEVPEHIRWRSPMGIFLEEWLREFGVTHSNTWCLRRRLGHLSQRQPHARRDLP